MLLFVLSFTFWLFYFTRVLSGEQRRRLQFYDVAKFSSSMVDAMVFVQYLAVVLIEIRHLTPE